jgi:hypothetical protein
MRPLGNRFAITKLHNKVQHQALRSGPQAKSKGDLGLVIVASNSPKYIKEWVSTPSEHGVTIKCLKAAKLDRLIVSSFLVTGLSADVQGSYSFSVSFYLLGPNGKPNFGQSNYAKCSGELPDKPVRNGCHHFARDTLYL